MNLTMQNALKNNIFLIFGRISQKKLLSPDMVEWSTEPLEAGLQIGGLYVSGRN